MERRYRIDEDQIVAEALEREVMVVNLDNGYYYAVEGTGAELWQWLTIGCSVAEVSAALAARYAGDPAAIETSVHEFVEQLVAESLLLPAPVDTPAPVLDVAEIADPRPAFTLPAMYKYTDMANLVQMDPIRDFDESVWPREPGAKKRQR